MITRVLVGAVVVMTSLAACTESPPAPPPAPPPGTAPESALPPTSPSPTPTPTVDLTVPPVPPEAMGTPSADGAAAAATYFTQLYAYAYATADLTAWKAMSDPTCTFCNSVIDGVTAMSAAGETDSSAEIVVTTASALEIDPGVYYSADLRMRQGPSERRDSAGTVISRGTGGSFDLVFALEWREKWIVSEVDSKSTVESGSP